jgi:hypothetical protein
MWKNIVIGVLTIVTVWSLLTINNWSTELSKRTEEQLKYIEETQKQKKVIQDMYYQELKQKEILEDKLRLCGQSTPGH